MDFGDLAFNKPMSNVGKRVIYPLPKNPADKSTIVSVFPRDIIEIKPTIFPQRFVIPEAKDGDFSLLILNGASYYTKAQSDRMPPNEVQINAAALAGSLVTDYMQATPLVVIGTRSPGIFWIPGEWDKKTIGVYKDEKGVAFDILLSRARSNQKNWFTAVLEEADVLWSRTNGNPRSISDDARLAAEMMGVASQKPWMSNQIASALEHCPACGEMINLEYPVCKFCHAVVNKKRAEELNLVFNK